MADVSSGGMGTFTQAMPRLSDLAMSFDDFEITGVPDMPTMPDMLKMPEVGHAVDTVYTTSNVNGDARTVGMEHFIRNWQPQPHFFLSSLSRIHMHSHQFTFPLEHFF